jgi:hypothetical protein
MARSRAAGNTSLTCEPSVRFELTASDLPSPRSNRWSYEGMSWAPRARTWILRVQSPAGLPTSPTAHREPFPRVELGSPPLQGAAGRRSEGHRCPRRDSNAHCRRPQRRASCHWATRTWSRHPVSNRVTRATRAGPQPCAAARLPDKDSNLDSRIQSPLSCHWTIWHRYGR